MAQSLSKFHKQAYVNLLLCLLVVAAAGYLILADMRDSLSRDRATADARGIAGEITRLIAAQRANLKQIAQRSDVITALQDDVTPTHLRLTEQIRAATPQAQAIHLLSNAALGGTQGLTHLAANYVHLIQKGRHQGFASIAEFRALDTPSEHYDLIEPVVTGDQKTVGYVVLSVSTAPLHSVIKRRLPETAYLTLYQTNAKEKPLTIMSFGDYALAEKAGGITASLGGLPWMLTYWPGEPMLGIFAGNRIYYLLFILFAVASLSVMSFDLYRRTREAIHHDIKSVGQMFRDVRFGDMRNQYPMKLEEFSPAFLYLQDSGKKLVEEKEKLKGMGLIDYLSQLNNRRYFEMRLKELFEQMATFPPSSVLIIDIDQFKAINDRFGHKAGDTLIVGIANALREIVRQTDFLARLGGDEFVVIYPHVSLSEATAFAERLRKLLPRQITLPRGLMHELRWSGGLSVMSNRDKRFSDVLWRADQALILAKEDGRHRTKIYDPTIDAEQDVHVDPYAHRAQAMPNAKTVGSDTRLGRAKLTSISRKTQ